MGTKPCVCLEVAVVVEDWGLGALLIVMQPATSKAPKSIVISDTKRSRFIIIPLERRSLIFNFITL
jgi:hypothetical protein